MANKISKTLKILVMKVGDKVYLKPIGNRSRYSQEIDEDVITKVGSKFFYTQHKGRFFIDAMIQDCGGYVSGYEAYLSLECLEEKLEREKLLDEIKRFFSAYGDIQISTQQLRQIKEIISESPKNSKQ